MLAPGNYVQWKSIIKKYIDTKPNHELIHYYLNNPPYEYTWADKVVPVFEGSPETTTVKYMENYKNVLQDIHDQLNAEAEAIQIILTGIDNDIYSTVDAYPNACEMWKAIKREQIDQNDDDDLANKRELLASLIEKLKCKIDDNKNRNRFLETSNKVLVDKLKETNALMYNDLKKFQAELDRRNDVKYESKRYFSKRSKMSHTPVNNGNSKESFNKQTTLLEKRMDESIPYDQKCKSSKELFKIKRSVATIFDGVERCKQTIAMRTYFGHIDPFIQNTIEANFCPEIRRINVDLKKFHVCLKEDMVADLRYFNSLELEVDSLKSQLETQKTQFLNEIDRLSREYYYANHMNAILGVYTELDEVTNLQCDYLELLEKYKCLEKELSKGKMMSKSFEALQKHALQEQIKHDKYFKEN
nr:hypothetical protein [Tanacetum cinerariifolium]